MLNLKLHLSDVVQVELQPLQVHTNAEVKLFLITDNQFPSFRLFEATLVMNTFRVGECIGVQSDEGARTGAHIGKQSHRPLVLAQAIFRGVVAFLVNFAKHNVCKSINKCIGTLLRTRFCDRLVGVHNRHQAVARPLPERSFPSLCNSAKPLHRAQTP